MAEWCCTKNVQSSGIATFGQWGDPHGTGSVAAKKGNKAAIHLQTKQAQGVELSCQPLPYNQHAFSTVKDMLVAFFRSTNDSKSSKNEPYHRCGNGQCNQ